MELMIEDTKDHRLKKLQESDYRRGGGPHKCLTSNLLFVFEYQWFVVRLFWEIKYVSKIECRM